MAHILTAPEAAAVLRIEETNPDMLNLLGAVDAYIKNATGRDWAADEPVNQSAKNAARMLLVLWFENPAMVGSGVTSLNHGLNSVLVQLEAQAMLLADEEAAV